MSSFLSVTEEGKYIKELESLEICKWRINDICCNDKSPYLADFPSIYCKCESKEDCEYFEEESEDWAEQEPSVEDLVGNEAE